jgi:uncharacterized membrane protein YdbT with pleckstrin-like domain
MDRVPVREFHPVVVPGQYYVIAPLASLFIAFFPGFFAFILSNILRGWSEPFAMHQSGPMVSVGLIVFVLAFGAVMVLFWYKTFKEPALTTYRIFEDSVEYDEGLFTRHRRTVLFTQLVDIELTEGMLQQPHGAGTITLVTNQMVSGPNNQILNRRIELKNVPQPREIYELLRSMALKRS